ncbi:MAG: GNAT family N-acetyltransferase [Candidatus Ornithospirochaeta sp.]
MKYILETERLRLRELEESDLDYLKETLQDPLAMYAYEGAFTDEEARAWLENQCKRYGEYGLGLWAVENKETSRFLGQCGLTYQPWKDEMVLEIGYLFSCKNWGKGYASEAARGVKKYAFETLKEKEVCSIIRATNTASMRVAVRNGMLPRDTFTKHYRGVDMLHIRFIAENTL